MLAHLGSAVQWSFHKRKLHLRRGRSPVAQRAARALPGRRASCFLWRRGQRDRVSGASAHGSAGSAGPVPTCLHGLCCKGRALVVRCAALCFAPTAANFRSLQQVSFSCNEFHFIAAVATNGNQPLIWQAICRRFVIQANLCGGLSNRRLDSMTYLHILKERP